MHYLTRNINKISIIIILRLPLPKQMVTKTDHPHGRNMGVRMVKTEKRRKMERSKDNTENIRNPDT